MGYAWGRYFTGTFGNDLLFGTRADDRIFGLFGDDDIRAGAGDDVVVAGLGDDRITGGAGNDTVLGGLGFDTAVYVGSYADYDISVRGRFIQNVTVSGGGEGRDTLVGIESLYFEADDRTVFLDGRNNDPFAGDDTVTASEDGATTFALADLLANDADFEGNTLSIISVSGEYASLVDGAVVFDPGTTFQYLGEGDVVVPTFTYTVSDGQGGTGTASVSVRITGQNDAPVIAATEAVSLAENTTLVDAQISAEDPEGDDLTYAIAGGADAALFAIDATTGTLSFVTAPDFEAPADADSDNVYDVSVSVSDTEGGSDSASIAVTVEDVAEPPTFGARINEFHYDNAGADAGEFVEIRVSAGSDVSQMAVTLYNGNGGAEYGSFALPDAPAFSDGTYDYYVIDTPGLQNGNDGIALSDGGTLIEFLSYEGAFTAVGGPADGIEATDVVVSETSGTGIGQSLQRNDDGSWRAPAAETRGDANDVETPPAGDLRLISEVQGSGAVAARFGEQVTVEAVVTYVAQDGFYLQEEDGDADGDAATSEGIFVFTGGSDLPSLGQALSVSGTVEEFFGLTQIGTVSNVTVLSDGNPMPTAGQIGLDPAVSQDFEAIEGMRVELGSGTDDPLTLIENFNFDRFGELTVSAGNQIQPTQVFDAQDQLAEVQALQQANLNNRLLIDDGVSQQNPDDFVYVPATIGDNGNGYLDAGDTFGADGPTVRLGAELVNTPTGVLSYGFGEYRLLIDNQLAFDPATNEGARPETPDEVGGDVQIAGFNVLNYFTTLSGGTGPDGSLDPRGAGTPEDLARQTDKLVEAILGTGAEVLNIQEVENNGFGPDSAIAALVGALNAEADARGTGQVFAFVDPTQPGEDGFIGTDAITNGIIYDSSVVTLREADYHVFDEDSAAQTLAVATVLSDVVGNEIGDFQRSRPVVAATFEDERTGETFTTASVHFKSKGDSGLASLADAGQAAVDAGNPELTQADVDALLDDPNFDSGDGQGFWNAVRADGAAETDVWLRTEFGGTGTDTFVVMGDYNAYTQEDPVQTLTDDAFYTDLLERYVGAENAYSFVFDGQRGALDQAVASDTFADRVTGLSEWHINADEPDLLSYNSAFTDERFYSPDQFGASDHDPILIGLDTGVSDLPVV